MTTKKFYLIQILAFSFSFFVLHETAGAQNQADCEQRYKMAESYFSAELYDSVLLVLKPCLEQKTTLPPGLAVRIKQLAAKTVVLINNWSANEWFKIATKHYKDGKIDSALVVLEPILNSRKEMKLVSKETRADIYRLAAHCNFIVENPEEAQENIKSMLAYRPYYKDDNANKDDIDRFTQQMLDLSPYALPKMTLGLRTGYNITSVKQTNFYSVLEMQHFNTKKKYTGSYGFHFGGIAQYAFLRNLSFSIEPNFIWQVLEYEISVFPNITNKAKQSFFYIEFPVLAKYYFAPLAKYNPYLQTGFQYKSLFNATRDQNFDLLNVLNGYDLGYILGAGVAHKSEKWTFALDFRYIQGMINLAKEETRYTNNLDNNNLVFEYYDVMDDFKLRNFQISFSWTYHLNYKVYR